MPRRAPSALAVNYILSLEDQLTPALAASEKGYLRFTKSIEKLNNRVERSITKTFDRLSRVVKEFTSITAVSTAMGKGKSVRAGGGRGLADQVAKGVSQALRNVQIRMHATVPAKKNAKFNTAVNLNRMYKQLPQPPDMVGLMEGLGAKKYAKGGLVTGTAGKDKVPALLTAGEFVMTKDQVKDIVKAAGALRNAQGTSFASGAGLTKVLTEMKVLTAQADKLRAAVQSGLDPKATKDYARVVERLSINEDKLVRETEMLSKANRIMLAPELMKVREEIDGIAKGVPKAATSFDKFLKSISSSAAFLALHAAVKTVQEDFLELRAATEHAVGEFGIDTAADGLVTNFNQMNRVLGLSRGALADLRNEFVDTVKQLPLGTQRFDMASEAMQHLVEIGAGPKIARELTPAISAFGQATGAASDATAELAYRMNKQLNIGAAGTADAMAYIAKVGSTMQVSVQGVTEALGDAYESNQAFFKSLNPQQAMKATQSLTQIAAAGESITTGFGKELTKTLADAAAGNADAFAKIGALGFGNMDDVRKALQSGDLSKMFNNLSQMDPLAMRAFAESIGVSADAAANLTFNTDELRKKLELTKGVTVKAGDGLKYLGQRALDNQSAFEHIRNVIGDLITGTFPNVIAFFKDLNPLVLISWIYLGSKLLPVLKGLTSWASTLLPMLPKLIARAIALGLAMKSWAVGSTIMDMTTGIPIKKLGVLGKVWQFLAKWGMQLVVAVIGIAGWFTKLAAVGGWLMTALTWVGRAIMVVVGGITALGAAIAAAVAAVVYLGYVIYKHWSAMPEIIDEAIKEIGDAINVALEFYGRKFSELFSWITTTASGIGTAISDALTGAGSSVLSFFSGLPAMLGGAMSTFASWVGKKLTGLIPDWVFTALNYAGIISDDQLAGMQGTQASIVAASTIAPAQTITAGSAAASNAALVEALDETNKHLAAISDNTEEAANVNVTVNTPRSPSGFASQLAAGM